MANQGNSVLRTKPVDRILSEATEHQGGLKRVLTAVDLTAIGVGAIIGAGIFVLTGTAARDAAGPSIMLSYVFAGIACILAALCYAEFSTRLPISGSAYTYAYASVGELFAWIIGWDLILEYTVGASTVAVGWTHYLEQFVESFFKVKVPPVLLDIPLGPFHVNLAATLLIVLLTTLLCIGIKESARFNAVMVAIKVAVVLFVIFAGMAWVNPDNWVPFIPPDYGYAGIIQGAALIFFAYIGFDAVSTAAEEVKNPQRDLPIGIIASLLICTVLYVAVAAVITGMVPYKQIDAGAPLAAAFGSIYKSTGQEFARWAQQLIGLGGFVGLTTVVLILLMSQPRIWFAMARDGLLFPWFSKIDERFRTPMNASILTGIIAIITAIIFPLEKLHHMVSIGTLFAFVVVSASVLIMRYKNEEKPHECVVNVLVLMVGLTLLALGFAGLLDGAKSPLGQTGVWAALIAGALISLFPLIMLFRAKASNIPTTFKCPGVPFVPILAMQANLLMMVKLEGEAWLRLVLWLLFGLIIYFCYGYWNSKLTKAQA